MSFDEQFRPALDNLTARLRRDVERHLDAAVEELSVHAEKLAATNDAERAAAVEQASRTAWAEAERMASERFERERDESERAALTHLAAERERLEQDTKAQLAAERAEMERLTLERLEAERSDAERATAERLASEYAASERATIARLAVEGADRERALIDQHGAAKIEAERAATARLTAETEAAEARAISRLRTDEIAAGDRLVRAFRSIDAGQTLSEILEMLGASAIAEAPRVAMFLVSHAQFKTWRFLGFEPRFTAADELTLSAEDAGIIAEAGKSRESYLAGRDTEPPAPPFANLAAGRRAVAVPLIVNDETVVVLYADEGPDGQIERPSWPATIEVLARHASRALEAITAHRLARTLSDRSGARPRPASGLASTPTQAPSLVASRPVAAAALNAGDQPLSAQHVSAQQYAKVLVSGIRTANESEVSAGLRDRNLMVRLGGEIARAWSQYESRVPEEIRANTNYFHAEMVKTLANGDASLLSPNR